MISTEDYNKIFSNGKQHIDAAILLATNDKYGFAISHLILGMEELIKYHVMLYSLDENEFKSSEIDPNNKRSIFHSHSTKHNILKEFVEASSLDFVEKYDNVQLNKIIGYPNKEEDLSVFENRFRRLGGFLRVAYAEFNITDEDRAYFLKWLEEANTQKNDGFYVDWINPSFKSPSEINIEDYDIALKFANYILKSIEVIKSLETPDEEFIDWMMRGD